MKLLFIDPMSKGSLANYDCGLLGSMGGKCQIHFFGRKENGNIPGNCAFHAVFGYYKYSSNVAKAVSYAMSMLRISLWAFANKPDVAHIQWIKLRPLDKVFLRLLHKIGCKVVFTAHNILPHDSDSSSIRAFFQSYYSALDAIIVHCATTKEEMLKMFDVAPQKIHVAKHGIISLNVDDEAVKAEMSKLELMYNLRDKMVFSSIGMQYLYKGFDMIKDIWQNEPAVSGNDGVILVIAGKVVNVDVSPLKGRRNVVVIDRYLSDVEFIALTRLTSVMLLPYTKISFSGQLMTSIEEGTPVLVSNVGGLGEPFEIARIGWNIGTPTKDNLLKCITHCINSPEEVSQIRSDSRSWDLVREAYSWQSISKVTEGVYRWCLSRDE